MPLQEVKKADTSHEMLILHGGSETNLEKFLKFQERVKKECATSSLSFNFIPNTRSSLKKRLEQALKVSKDFFGDQKKVVLGVSMGAYTALQLTQHIDIDVLILCVPAVYGKDVIDTPF